MLFKYDDDDSLALIINKFINANHESDPQNRTPPETFNNSGHIQHISPQPVFNPPSIVS